MRPLLALALLLGGCEPFASLFGRNVEALISGPLPVAHRIADPRTDADLSALWIGHATVLLQLGDRFVITDPVFSTRVAQVSTRLVEPGLLASDLPPIDLGLLSHPHFDHLSYESLEMIEGRLAHFLVPRGALVHVPNYAFPSEEVGVWEQVEIAGMTATAVPVVHEGFRYGVDASWTTEGAAAWVVQHQGVTIYFGGDSAYAPERCAEILARVGPIDLALLPIGPVAPRAVMARTHMDGREALLSMEALGAAHMIPIHYATFAHGADDPGAALARLEDAIDELGVDPSRVHVLPIGGQLLMGRTDGGWQISQR